MQRPPASVHRQLHPRAGRPLDSQRLLGHPRDPGEGSGGRRRRPHPRGYRLPARYVLHTLGPHLNGGEITDEDREKLAACYTSCLDLALEKGDIHNVSFCALSTGRNNFPFEEATHIALDTVNQWLQYHGTDVIELVVFNIFEDADAEGYMQALESWVED